MGPKDILVKTIVSVCGICVISGWSQVASAADKYYTPWRNDIAVGGYDTVSFFSGTPQKGISDFSVTYDGVEWQFKNQGNLDLFRTNPEAFIPQYGGYCAWAVANNRLFKGSPKFWSVEDGKLYLKFNKRVQRLWERDKTLNINQGNEHWPQILDD